MLLQSGEDGISNVEMSTAPAIDQLAGLDVRARVSKAGLSSARYFKG
jgi:hypothetical protein